ncbi:Hypothetical protein CpCap5W_1776 [Corynebacterium pseudotuberculosis]|nr:Hypothetical protein Cp267_0962 [Corynebacterium pseudotuberculosis 267]AJC13660.1 Hypothetical protein CpVD57_0943 [Corynebacterium pseudotuberculosis]AKJ55596.1 Hypothetical protein Cp12C_0974 [Corynebacterium pseudotuberculosis]ALM78271.1 Hypothetical protein Cp1002B_1743 [Corynebacterium pseudotuberculosis]ANQ77113.1 Hypothetical protein CpCP13_0942 [Corynebacterium pseudotuberculosis]
MLTGKSFPYCSRSCTWGDSWCLAYYSCIRSNAAGCGGILAAECTSNSDFWRSAYSSCSRKNSCRNNRCYRGFYEYPCWYRRTCYYRICAGIQVVTSTFRSDPTADLHRLRFGFVDSKNSVRCGNGGVGVFLGMVLWNIRNDHRNFYWCESFSKNPSSYGKKDFSERGNARRDYGACPGLGRALLS